MATALSDEAENETKCNQNTGSRSEASNQSSNDRNSGGARRVSADEAVAAARSAHELFMDCLASADAGDALLSTMHMHACRCTRPCTHTPHDSCVVTLTLGIVDVMASGKDVT